MNKLIPTFITIGATLLSTFTPEIQGFIGAHSKLGVVLAGIYAVINHFLPSPVASSTPAAKPETKSAA